MTQPTYDPYNVPPPRRPKTPWWKTKPAAAVYLVLLLWAMYLLDARGPT
jgi:hypothetical protein